MATAADEVNISNELIKDCNDKLKEKPESVSGET